MFCNTISKAHVLNTSFTLLNRLFTLDFSDARYFLEQVRHTFNIPNFPTNVLTKFTFVRPLVISRTIFLIFIRRSTRISHDARISSRVRPFNHPRSYYLRYLIYVRVYIQKVWFDCISCSHDLDVVIIHNQPTCCVEASSKNPLLRAVCSWRRCWQVLLGNRAAGVVEVYQRRIMYVGLICG